MSSAVLALLFTLGGGVSEPDLTGSAQIAPTSDTEPLLAQLGSRCEVRALADEERASVDAARAHARAALEDPGVRALLNKRAPAGQLLSPRVSAALDRSVSTFGGAGCPGPLARGRANAITTRPGGSVLVARAYLGRALVPGLAGTLAHEAAHLLGYEHARASYATSVPVFLGCLVRNYPDLAAARTRCGGASSSENAAAGTRQWSLEQTSR